MAKTLYDKEKNNTLVGAFVYPHSQPLKAGKIVAVVGNGRVKARWLDGSETEVSTLGLKDFMSLLEDARKKIKTHEATLEKLLSI